MEDSKPNTEIKQINTKKNKKKKKRILWIGIIAVIILIVVAVVLSGKKEKLIEVQTEKVMRQNITQIVTATGKIQAETKVVISAEVSGEIISLPFKEGDVVKKGDVVVKIRPDSYMPKLKQEQAGINVQQSNLAAQEVNLKKYKLELDRIKTLTDKGLASQQDLDNAQTNFDATLAQMNTVRAQIQQQRASLSSVEYDVSKTTINAPMSGTVTQLNNEEGEKVLGTSFNIGSQIMTISDLNSMECQVEVGETDVTLVKLGDTARIQIDAFPGKSFTGYVYEIANTAKAKNTGTQEEVVNFIVKIRVSKEDYELRPGMSCTVDIEVQRKDNVVAVPIQSVTTREDDMQGQMTLKGDEKDKSMPDNLSSQRDDKIMKKQKPKEIVFVVENGTAVKKEVKTGISNDAYIEIIEGVPDGVEVIKGSFKAINKDLDNNMKVKVNNEKKVVKKDKE
ncbi:MAG: efflux RND transporter periplasmic adaptor subunit [Ignavibacteriota bacterium]|nr:efflux RND transporter periplasmic adaptor subunit [Ignavibacteriota bacterium]